MPPEHEVHTRGQERLLNGTRGARRGLRAVLVQREYVEPRLRITRRPRYVELLALQSARQLVVVHVAHAVERELGCALADEQRRECDVRRVRHLAKVIEQVGRREQVER